MGKITVLVKGNDSTDLDSIISAIVLAKLITNSTKDPPPPPPTDLNPELRHTPTAGDAITGRRGAADFVGMKLPLSIEKSGVCIDSGPGYVFDSFLATLRRLAVNAGGGCCGYSALPWVNSPRKRFENGSTHHALKAMGLELTDLLCQEDVTVTPEDISIKRSPPTAPHPTPSHPPPCPPDSPPGSSGELKTAIVENITVQAVALVDHADWNHPLVACVFDHHAVPEVLLGGRLVALAREKNLKSRSRVVLATPGLCCYIRIPCASTTTIIASILFTSSASFIDPYSCMYLDCVALHDAYSFASQAENTRWVAEDKFVYDSLATAIVAFLTRAGYCGGEVDQKNRALGSVCELLQASDPIQKLTSIVAESQREHKKRLMSGTSNVADILFDDSKTFILRDSEGVLTAIPFTSLPVSLIDLVRATADQKSLADSFDHYSHQASISAASHHLAGSEKLSPLGTPVFIALSRMREERQLTIWRKPDNTCAQALADKILHIFKQCPESRLMPADQLPAVQGGWSCEGIKMNVSYSRKLLEPFLRERWGSAAVRG